MRLRVLGISTIAVPVLAWACVGDAPVATPNDGGSDSNTSVDSGADVQDAALGDVVAADVGSDGPIDAGPRCDPTKDFDAPVLEPVVNTALDEDIGRLSSDELELYLTRQDPGGKRVFRYTRAQPADPWGAPSVQTTLTVAGPAIPASVGLSLEPAGLNAYIAVLQTDGTWRITFTTRPNLGAAWQAPVILTGTHGADGTDEQPWINRDATRLYFMSNRGGGVFRVYVSPFSNGVFQAASLVDAPDSANESRYPVLSDDELTMYFSSYDSTNGLRAYKKTRSSIGGPWSARTVVPAVNGSGLNSGSRTYPTWLSKDTCVMYLNTNRGGGVGLHDVWRATKPK